MKHLHFWAAPALLLCACTTAPVLTEIKVPIPVECREEVPSRPVMPTEEFKAKPTLDQFTQAAQAELERREGYELQLRTALEACREPIK
jgi:hypothetical protein